MHADLVHALSARRAEIEARWKTFLRLEPVSSPLGHPDTLVFGIEGALRAIMALLWQPPAETAPGPVACACGCNPLHAFFVAGEQALLETLVLVQSESSQPVSVRERAQALEELRRAVRHVAHQETSLIAGLCQRPKAAN